MDIIKRQGVFRLYDRGSAVIFTDEKQLDRIIESPDKPLFSDEERGFSFEKRGIYDEKVTTLNTILDEAEQNHCERVEASYDFFFGGTTRCNYPSSETTLRCFKAIHDAARARGMKFGASILNPLDIGGGYIRDHDVTGYTCQFKEAELQPDGSYCCPMICQKQWNNNKGPTHPRINRLLCYAFSEERLGDTSYFFVDPDRIVDVSSTASLDIHEDTYTVTGYGYGSCKMDFRGKCSVPGADRVLCVVEYQTPELDYFAPEALDYFKEVLDLHNSRGITYDGFYSDEMHIQFDWDLVAHFGEDEINTRYLTPNLIAEYARLYGEQYKDFYKYLIYVAYHQHDFLPGEAGREGAQHVFGRRPEDVYATWLFRNRYFELLQGHVVDLCCKAKEYAESLWGAPIMTRAHATWQESPTCDHYYHTANEIGGYNVSDQLTGFEDVTIQSAPERRAAFELAKYEKVKELGVSRYDYTPWYDWSSSIRENTAACYDYFKWNDYLSGGGTDHPEGGNLDRDYFGQALASSFGLLNRFKIAYCAGWGMPKVVSEYFRNVGNVYGNQQFGGNDYNFVQGLHPRETDVLALYPIELNNVEERFGSWMVQYGYCNYISEQKFLQYAELTPSGRIRILDSEYRAMVVLFEPFLDPRTHDLLRRFVEAGGKLLWMSVYPVLTPAGESAAEAFQSLFGIAQLGDAYAARSAKGKSVQFTGAFSGIREMPILNDYLVDRVYPFTPAEGTEVVATLDGAPAASLKRYPNGGLAVYAGFRVRDDQSCSLGEDVDTLFRVLMAMGAYRPGSLEAKSRETSAKYLMLNYSNGAVAVAPHYRGIYEAWEGTFFREDEVDALMLKDRVLPDRHIHLDEDLLGQRVRYDGSDYMSYRYADGRLLGFSGTDTTGITVDGDVCTLSDRPAKLNFGLVPQELVCEGVRELYMVTCYTEGAVLTLPVGGGDAPRAEVCGVDVYRTVGEVPFAYENGTVRLTVTPELVGKQIAIVR